MLDPVYRYLLRFVDISAEEFAFIQQFAEIRHFDRRERLINAGEYEAYLNFIAKGVIRKFFYRNKDEVVTQIAKEEELICSSVSFMSGELSEYAVEAVEPATVVSISRQNLDELYQVSPKMERMGRLVIVDWLLQKEQWENARIRQTPKERFLQFAKDNPDLMARVPQKFLASYLDIKPETFSRYKHLLTHHAANRM